MTEKEIATIVVDACVQIHRSLGPGLMESVYESILADELGARGLDIQQQVAVPVVWGHRCHPIAFRIDLLVENAVVVELKSLDRMAPAHTKQLLTYLRLADKRLGLLVNFGMPLARDGIKRVVNNLPEGPEPQ